MTMQHNIECEISTLGLLQAQCDLWAYDPTYTTKERLDLLNRAEAYREEQRRILENIPDPVNKAVAKALIAEMEQPTELVESITILDVEGLCGIAGVNYEDYVAEVEFVARRKHVQKAPLENDLTPEQAQAIENCEKAIRAYRERTRAGSTTNTQPSIYTPAEQANIARTVKRPWFLGGGK